MENFSTVPSQGKYSDSIAAVNNNFMLAHDQLQQLEYDRSKNLGMFSSFSDLPSDAEDSYWATVVSSGVFTAYIREDGDWVSKGTYTPTTSGSYAVITQSEMDNVLG